MEGAVGPPASFFPSWHPLVRAVSSEKGQTVVFRFCFTFFPTWRTRVLAVPNHVLGMVFCVEAGRSRRLPSSHMADWLEVCCCHCALRHVTTRVSISLDVLRVGVWWCAVGTRASFAPHRFWSNATLVTKWSVLVRRRFSGSSLGIWRIFGGSSAKSSWERPAPARICDERSRNPAERSVLELGVATAGVAARFKDAAANSGQGKSLPPARAKQSRQPPAAKSGGASASSTAH